MLGNNEILKLDALFPVLAELAEQDRERLFSAGQLVHLPEGQMLMQQNQTCRYIPLVISGLLRVYKLSAAGREMTLFRTGPGDTCLVSIACQLRGEDFPALAQVEQEADLFLLPLDTYYAVLDVHPAWKNFLIHTLYGHLLATMQTLEAVAFDRTDRRLADLLLSHGSMHQNIINMTHEALAIELGTAREVVSRLLGELKSKGALKLGRGRIEIINPAILQEILDRG